MGQGEVGTAMPDAEENEAAKNGSPFFISVVIVNYNGTQWLEGCLSSLTAQTFKSFEIVLVDNASTDESCALVEKKFPHVSLVRSKMNVGFASGNNIGIRAARGNLIATLNTDTRVEPDYLEKLAAPMQNSNIGACAPLMLEMEHPDTIDAAGLRIDAFGFAWNIDAGQPLSLRGARRCNHRMRQQQSPTNSITRADTDQQLVYGACAGAALYRRSMLDAIGMFDDAYFGFYEDADLAWRAHNVGWKTAYVPAARVYHQHGASFGRIAPRKTYLLARNRWWTMFKNYPMPQFALALPIILMLDSLSLLQAALRGHFSQAWQGRRDAWRTRKQMWAKRGMDW
jgi:GT2 family glycosyltransferase